MSKSVGVPLIVLSHKDQNATAINATLRQAGLAVHCRRVVQLNELESALQQQAPELLILFDEESGPDLIAVAEQLSRLKPTPPLLLVKDNVTEQAISEAMAHGAKDVISLTHAERFKSVVARELQAYRMQVALGGVMQAANQYKEELRTLMEGSAEAIADVLEGIIVAANPTWVELFGYAGEEDLIALPFMDLCDEADQPLIKGALVACLRDKWDDTTLKMKARRAGASVATIEINLERITIDGDPGVRVIVPGPKGAQETPVELLERAVQKDPATGFYQRHFFLEKVEERINTPLTGGVRAIAYIRPDNFSRVHDDIGMLATEKLLTHLSELLREFMQSRDIYGRFGGTMFVALLERGTLADAETWAEQLRKTIEDHAFEVDGHTTSLTATIGLAEISAADRKSMTEVFGEVEQACRDGRQAGGNQVQLTRDANETQIMRQRESTWIPRIRAALMSNRLRLVHQPISSLNEEIEGMLDTRVQMLDEDGNTILASKFIPVAERAKLIKNIDRWVINASFAYCTEKQPTLVFVRLSADSIKDKTLPDWLNLHISRTKNDPSQVCFQISEAVASKNLRQTRRLAAKLSQLGFRFAIDHVGGPEHDGGKILHQMPMGYLKIDGGLMQGLHRNSDMQEKVRNIADLAGDLGIKTIAERVEDANTMAILWQLGISFIQGNYIQMRGVVLEDTQTSRGLAIM